MFATTVCFAARRTMLCLMGILLWTAPSPAQVPADNLSRDHVMAYRGPSGGIRPVQSVDDWQQRRQSIVDAMQTVMGKLPRLDPRDAPAYRVLEQADCDSYVRQKIEYQSQSGAFTPAYLCIPKSLLQDASDRVPAVLCLHPTDNRVGHQVVVGLGGKPNRQYADELAQRGYVTLSPSYPLLANYQPDLDALGWESGTLKAVWDNIRGVDLVQSLPMVQPDAIGAIGHSLGGHNSVYTAVFDKRIQVVVSSCGLDLYRDYYDGNPANWALGKGWTSTRYMPKLAEYQNRLDELPFDFAEMVAALAPRHTLIIAPLHDSNFRAASVDRLVASARPVFDLYGDSDRLMVEHPDVGHDFPDDMRQRAYRLFDQVLRKEKP